MSLTHKVMLANLSISVFSGEKVDRNVSTEIADKHHTTMHNAGRFSKKILARSSIERLKQIAGSARTEHYARTLPWSDKGPRLLSIAGFFDYTAMVDRYKGQFDAEVHRFIESYPDMIEEAKTRLNGMFDEADYPDIRTLRRRFAFDIGITPLSDGANWFLDLAEDDMNTLKAHVDQRFNAGINDAIKNVYQQIADVTEKMAARLNNYETDETTGKVVGPVFRDSLVENVRDLADLLPSLNITDDPLLADLAVKMKSDLCKFDANALRVDPTFRKKTADAATSIFSQVSQFL